jgi:hypothetical protein
MNYTDFSVCIPSYTLWKQMFGQTPAQFTPLFEELRSLLQVIISASFISEQQDDSFDIVMGGDVFVFKNTETGSFIAIDVFHTEVDQHGMILLAVHCPDHLVSQVRYLLKRIKYSGVPHSEVSRGSLNLVENLHPNKFPQEIQIEGYPETYMQHIEIFENGACVFKSSKA